MAKSLNILGQIAASALAFSISSQELALPKKVVETKLEQIAKENERIGKRAFQLFLKCDGKNGNADFGYSQLDVQCYRIIDDKCEYICYGMH